MIFYQTMPPLSPDEYAELRDSILKHGITVPVIVDEQGNVIDGHHRVTIARELDITYPTRVLAGLSEEEKLDQSVMLNIARRQLTRDQRRSIIAEQLKRHPEKSNREHARQVGVDHKTVNSIRESLESTGEIPQLDRTVGADGKERPATRPTASTLATPSGVVIAEQRHVELVDTNTGEIVETAPEPRKVTGLDGKQYAAPKPKRHVIDTAEEAELVNAKTAAQRIGSSLMTLDAFTVRQHRQRILFRWWPLGKEFVPPDERELFQPSRLRDIADGLNQLALDMEAQEQ